MGQLRAFFAPCTVLKTRQACGPNHHKSFAEDCIENIPTVCERTEAYLVRYERSLDKLVLVGTAASRFEVAPIAPELHPHTLVLHGEQDDTVPLTSVLDWARPQTLPVTVIPGVAHFFHGQLPLLKS